MDRLSTEFLSSCLNYGIRFTALLGEILFAWNNCNRQLVKYKTGCRCGRQNYFSVIALYTWRNIEFMCLALSFAFCPTLSRKSYLVQPSGWLKMDGIWVAVCWIQISNKCLESKVSVVCRRGLSCTVWSKGLGEYFVAVKFFVYLLRMECRNGRAFCAFFKDSS